MHEPRDAEGLPDAGHAGPEECLDQERGGCRGAVELRPSLTGTGLAIPRCDAHWAARLDWEEEHRTIYPDSDLPPAWFDPTAAGERWAEDD